MNLFIYLFLSITQFGLSKSITQFGLSEYHLNISVLRDYAHMSQSLAHSRAGITPQFHMKATTCCVFVGYTYLLVHANHMDMGTSINF